VLVLYCCVIVSMLDEEPCNIRISESAK
jgi:hypothetical protein